MRNGNRPTPEFRREALRLALTSGRPRREIAEDLGIGLSRQAHSSLDFQSPIAFERKVREVS